MQNALQCTTAFNSDEPFSHGAGGGKEYRVITRVKNNLLLSAIEAAGYESVHAFAEAIGSNAGSIGNGVVGLGGDWTGSAVYRSDDGGANYALMQTLTAQSTIGAVLNIIPAATIYTWDNSTAL